MKGVAQRHLSVPVCLRVIVQQMYLQRAFFVASPHLNWEFEHTADELGTSSSRSITSCLWRQKTGIFKRARTVLITMWMYTIYVPWFSSYTIHPFTFASVVHGHSGDGACSTCHGVTPLTGCQSAENHQWTYHACIWAIATYLSSADISYLLFQWYQYFYRTITLRRFYVCWRYIVCPPEGALQQQPAKSEHGWMQSNRVIHD